MGMWIIHAGYAVPIPIEKQLLVGRANASILLNDKSVSRRHAVLMLSDNTLLVEDCGSKFGTFVNGKKLNSNDAATLKSGDIIEFGIQGGGRFSVTHYPISVCFSGLSSMEKSEMRDICDRLGISIASSVQEESVTHLVTSKLRITEKLVLSLIHSKFIVSMEWLNAISDQLKQFDGRLVGEEAFVPEWATETFKIDKSLVSLSPNPKRRKLFSSLTFFSFEQDQTNRLISIISAADGRIELLKEDDEIPTESCPIILPCDLELLLRIKKKYYGLLLVSEPEIGLSILYAENGKFKKLDSFKRKLEVQVERISSKEKVESTLSELELITAESEQLTANSEQVTGESEQLTGGESFHLSAVPLQFELSGKAESFEKVESSGKVQVDCSSQKMRFSVKKKKPPNNSQFIPVLDGNTEKVFSKSSIMTPNSLPPIALVSSDGKVGSVMKENWLMEQQPIKEPSPEKKTSQYRSSIFQKLVGS